MSSNSPATYGAIDHEHLIGLSNPGNDVAIAKALPENLRTNHWYCDLHHSMFLILLVNAATAMEENRPQLAKYFIDTVTIYWIEHSLMEEEGMALSLDADLVEAPSVERHARSHVGLTRWWWNAVVVPFDTEGTPPRIIRDALHKFYRMVIQHIQEFDQPTYGKESGHSDVSVCSEIAHLANSGLPLSPQMPGTHSLMQVLAPQMMKTMSTKSLADCAGQPGKPLNLTSNTAPLWTGGKGAFRDVLIKSRVMNRRMAA